MNPTAQCPDCYWHKKLLAQKRELRRLNKQMGHLWPIHLAGMRREELTQALQKIKELEAKLKGLT